MAQVFAGCQLERLPNPKGALLAPRDERKTPLSFFEFAPRAPLPTFATLARFRKQFRGEVQIALVAPRTMYQTPKGAMRPGPELEEGLRWLTKVADMLDCFAIVLATGNDLTPGERDKSLIQAFVERLLKTGRKVVFAPRGLWEPEDAGPYCARIGAIYGFDPLEEDAPGGALVYGRVRPMGARPRLTEGHLVQVAERAVAAGAETAYVSIESETSLRDAQRLTAALAGLELLDDDEDDEELDEDDELDEDADLDEAEEGEEVGELDEEEESDGEAAEDDELDGDEEFDEDESDDDESDDDEEDEAEP